MRELREFHTSGPNGLPMGALSVLRFCTINEPLLPNLKILDVRAVDWLLIQFIPFFLSPRITSITLKFGSDCPGALVASMVSSLPTLCPDLQTICLRPDLPANPMITTAVSGVLLVTDQNKFRQLDVVFPLTEEASEMVYKLPNLRSLSVAIGRGTPPPPASLPNLTKLEITCDNEGVWPQLFHGAALGKLESVTFYPNSEEIGDFLGTFEKVALSSSVQNTLSTFHVRASCSWNPNYSSLLSLTQLVDLEINSFCQLECSSRIDDDIIIDISRAMPKLQVLKLGDDPCQMLTVGVTAKGLMTLALRCPDLSHLRIHFQVASLSVTQASLGNGRSIELTGPRTDCALAELAVGEIQVPEKSTLVVAQTLLHIFPRIEAILSLDFEGWKEVEDAFEDHRSFK